MEISDFDRLYKKNIPILEQMCKKINSELDKAFENIPHIDRISFRVKKIDSFHKKLLKKEKENDLYQNPLKEMEDQIGGRIIVFFLEDIGVVRKILEDSFLKIESFHKHPVNNKQFDYESFHYIFLIPGFLKDSNWNLNENLPKTFELQIRTIFMHAYAEPQHDFAYKKNNKMPDEVEKRLAWIAASSWGADSEFQRLQNWEIEKLSVVVWKNGKHNPKGNGYGLKIQPNDRDKYFNKEWDKLIIEFQDQDKDVMVNIGKRSFWNGTCCELISSEIGEWLYKNQLAPWIRNHPPTLYLVPITQNRFRLYKNLE